MAPTNKDTPTQLVQHKAVVTGAPPGEGTFGVECIAGDFFSSRVFATELEAKNAPDLLEHLAQRASDRVEPRAASGPRRRFGAGADR
jgi:hypothetical protein